MKLNVILNEIDNELGRIRKCSEETIETLKTKSITIVITRVGEEEKYLVFIDVCRNLVEITRFVDKKIVSEIMKSVGNALNDVNTLKKITEILASETNSKVQKITNVLQPT